MRTFRNALTLSTFLVVAGCSSSTPKCDFTTCSTGCCDASGECIGGASPQACGQFGAACRACQLNEYCSGGACLSSAAQGGGVGTTGGGSASGGGVGTTGGGSGATGGGSATTGGGSGSTGGGSGGPVSCRDGLTSCGGRCVDLTSNATNCGACGEVCGSTRTCTNGACVGLPSMCSETNPCPVGSWCDGNGACRSGCSTNDECPQPGACDLSSHRCTCATGRTACGDDCVAPGDITACGSNCEQCTPPVNGTATCGTSCDFTCNPGTHRCGNTCAPNTSVSSCGSSCTPCTAPANATPTCDGTSCDFTCNTGFHRCGNQCVSNTSINSCGTSCSACTPPANSAATCNGTSCGFTCNVGTHACSGACVSNTAVATCGSSCTPCMAPANAMATCNGTSCGFACNTGFHACSGACVSNTAVATCGSSCTPCTAPANATPTCNGTTCDFTCNTGFHRCGNQCLPNDSIDSCGSLCTTCPAGPSGSQRTCTSGACGFTCLGGLKLCNGACVNVGSDEANCGACGVACPSGDVCSQGACRLTCTQPWTASAAGLIDAGTAVFAMYPTHFDNDGLLDLTVVNEGLHYSPYTSGSVSNWRNTGGFTFVDAGFEQRNKYVDATTMADMNGDGRKELVLLASYDDYTFPSNEVVYFQGRDGGLNAGQSAYSDAYTFGGLTSGDFTGDGVDEAIIVGNSYSGRYDDPYSLYMVQRTSSSFSVTNLDAGISLTSMVASGDFNRDGKLDVLSASSQTNGQVRLYLGYGNGWFQSPLAVTTRTGVAAIRVGDIDGDGALDAVLIPTWGTGTPSVVVLKGTSVAPYLTVAQGLSLPWPFEYAQEGFSLVDLNADGYLDLVTSWGQVSTQFGNFMPSLGVADGTASGSFNNLRTIPLPSNLGSTVVATGDFDNDRTMDIAVGGSQKVLLMRGVCR